MGRRSKRRARSGLIREAPPARPPGLWASARAALGPEAAWWWPLLIALVLAPSIGGTLDAAPACALAGLVWIAFFLRLALRRTRDRPFPDSWALRLLIGFVALAALSIVASVYRGASLTAFALYAAWLAAFALAADLARARQDGEARAGATWLLIALLAGVFLAAASGFQDTLRNGLRGEWHWRTFGTFANPNLYASSLLLGLPVAAALALRAGGVLALLPALAFLLFVSQLLSTGSRGGIFTALGGLAVLGAAGIWVGNLRARGRWLRLGALLMAAVPVAALSASPLEERSAVPPAATASDILCAGERRGGGGESNAFRQLTWQGTLRMVEARPLAGHGVGTFSYAFSRYAVAGFTRHAHQNYLQLAAETGVPALLLWLAALGAGFWSLVRWRNGPWWAPGVAAALAGSAAHNLIDSTWMAAGNALPFWALLGLAAGAGGRGAEDGRWTMDDGRRTRDEGRVTVDEGRSTADHRPRTMDGGRRTRDGGPRARGPSLLWIVLALPCAALALAAGLADNLDRHAVEITRREPHVARETLEQAKLVAPWNAQVRYDLAAARLQTGNVPGAAREIRQAIALAPTHGPFYLRLGRIQESEGDLAGAVETYRRGLGVAPASTALLLALAEALERAGDTAGAQAEMRRIVAIEAGPVGQVRPIGEMVDYRFGVAHHELGAAAAGRKDLESARREYLTAACGFRWIRQLEGSPLPYAKAAGIDPATMSELRGRESSLWRWLANDFRQRRDAERARAADELAEESGRDR